MCLCVQTASDVLETYAPGEMNPFLSFSEMTLLNVLLRLERVTVRRIMWNITFEAQTVLSIKSLLWNYHTIISYKCQSQEKKTLHY